MTEWLLPLGVTAASLTLTYFLCLRPMRKGHCGAGPRRQQASQPEWLDHDLEQARVQLDSLRAGSNPSAPGQPLERGPNPQHDRAGQGR